jgi:SRSO17 transposase
MGEASTWEPDRPVQALLEGGDKAFEALCWRIDPRFARREVRQRLRRYLKRLLSNVPRRNGWQLAEQIGESCPNGVQRLVRVADWDVDKVRDDLRSYVVEHLGEAEGVLVVDETGFLKQGKRSVGVKRQYSGTAGRIENCQVGVFLGYATSKGFAFLDRELYLPEEWAENPERRKQAGVPEAVEFATKPALARQMLQRALDAGVPCRWVTADEVYGENRRLRRDLEERHQPFVLAVSSKESLWVQWERCPQQKRVSVIVEALSEEAWVRLSCGDGTKGPRFYDWAWVPLARWPEPGWKHGLLVRRSLSDPKELAYYVVFAPKDAPLEEIVRVAGARWTIESGFESAKQEGGLDEYEVRKWEGWYRYITLALLAHAFLSVLRSQLEGPEKGGRGSGCRVASADGPRSSSAALPDRMASGHTPRSRPPLVEVEAATPSEGQTLSL